MIIAVYHSIVANMIYNMCIYYLPVLFFCLFFINNVPDGYRIAVVIYASQASIRYNLVTINNHTRQEAINALNVSQFPAGQAIGQGNTQTTTLMCDIQYQTPMNKHFINLLILCLGIKY